MAISSGLYKALIGQTGWSPAKLGRIASALARQHGPMTPDEARYIVAHEHGINLRKHGVSASELDRVRMLRAAGAASAVAERNAPVAPPRKETAAPAKVETRDARPVTPSALFDSRDFHPHVVKSSKKRFVSGHRSDALRAAFVSVNNRVRRMSGILDADDGQALVSRAFGDKMPVLRMTGLSTLPERDEQIGLQFLAMGGMRGIRNPRSHADEQWWTDEDPRFVLEALALASLLHRCLDHCEARNK